MHNPKTTLAACALCLCAALPAAAMTNVFFLHHSTGRYLLDEGGVRATLAAYNQSRGTHVELWDHDYNSIGLRNPDGAYLGYGYDIPDDNTDPDGLYVLWTTSNSAREQILQNHQVIAFKSCFPASEITSDTQLDQRQNWYLAMRDVFDQHPDKVFIVISQPPLHRLATNATQAARARAFADWLGSSAYLSGHPNVRFFDLFDHLAAPDDGSATANMLRWEYERSHTDTDSHPNVLANQTVAPDFTDFLVDTAASVTPVEAASWGNVKSTWR